MSLIISKLKLWACWKLKIFEFPSKPFKFNKTTAWPEISTPLRCLNSLSLFQTLKLFVSVKLESSFATLTTYNYRKLGQIKVSFYFFYFDIFGRISIVNLTPWSFINSSIHLRLAKAFLVLKELPIGNSGCHRLIVKSHLFNNSTHFFSLKHLWPNGLLGGLAWPSYCCRALCNLSKVRSLRGWFYPTKVHAMSIFVRNWPFLTAVVESTIMHTLSQYCLAKACQPLTDD